MDISKFFPLCLMFLNLCASITYFCMGDIKHGSKFTELAPEYLRGFLYGFKGLLVPEGTKFRKGNECTLALHHLRINK